MHQSSNDEKLFSTGTNVEHKTLLNISKSKANLKGSLFDVEVYENPLYIGEGSSNINKGDKYK